MRLLLRAFTVLALLVLLPRLAPGQQEPNPNCQPDAPQGMCNEGRPPMNTFQEGTFEADSTSWSATWYAEIHPQSPDQCCNARVTLNGVDVPVHHYVNNNLSYATQGNAALGWVRGDRQCTLNASCYQAFNFRMTLNLDPTIVNVVVVTINDSQGETTTRTAYVQYAGRPRHRTAVQVSPDQQRQEWAGTRTLTYTLRNAGARSGVFRLTTSCVSDSLYAIHEGGWYVNHHSCPITSSTTVTLAPNQSQPVSVHVTKNAGAWISNPAPITLIAVDTADATAADTGRITLVQGTALPTVVIAPETRRTSLDRGGCVAIGIVSGAANVCGSLQMTYSLPGIVTKGRVRAPTLLYSSDFYHDPVIELDIGFAGAQFQPDSINVRVEGTTPGIQNVVLANHSYSGSHWSGGRRMRLGVFLNTVFWQGTGIHGYRVIVSGRDAGNGGSWAELGNVSGEITIVNRHGNSAYGSSWNLAEVERLYVGQPGGRVLLVHGDGSTAVYWPDASQQGRWIRRGGAPPDTVFMVTGGYERRPTPGVAVTYDGLGRQATVSNIHGDTTRYAYDGSSERIVTIAIPPAAQQKLFRFNYNPANGRLTTVESPGTNGARVTGVFIGSWDSIDSIVAFDGTRRRFEYAPWGPWINYMWDERNVKTHWFKEGCSPQLYQATVFKQNGTDTMAVHRFRQTHGVNVCPQPSPYAAVPHPSDSAFFEYDGPRTDVRDVTRFWVDSMWSPVRIQNALGDETEIVRADPRFPRLATEVRAPGSRVSRVSYDWLARPDTVTQVNPLGNGQDARTVYQYNYLWRTPTNVKSPDGVITYIDLYQATGLPYWVQTGPSWERRTYYRYYANGQVSAVQQTANPALTDSLAYDALGNVRMVRSAAGQFTWSHKDALGRDTLVIEPGDVRQRIVYNSTGDDTLHVTYKDGDSIVVVKQYDVSGQVKRVSNRTVPDPNGIGAVVREYAYDELGRKSAEFLVGDNRLSEWQYDGAGNLTWGGARGSAGPVTRYDALNRPWISVTTWSTGVGDPVGIAADTTVFAHDATGAIRNADNAAARISRTYFPGGALKSEVVRVRGPKDPVGQFPRQFRHDYQYDIAGRRTGMQRTFGSGVGYAYSPELGELRQASYAGWTFDYRTDLRGMPDSVIVKSNGTLAGVETFAFNSDGVAENHFFRRGTAQAFAEQYDTDARGRVHGEAYGPSSHGFAPLGPLTGSQLPNQPIESFIVDPLGRRRQGHWEQLGPTREEHSFYRPGTDRLLKTIAYSAEAWNRPDTVGFSYHADGSLQMRRALKIGSEIFWNGYGSGVYANIVTGTLHHYSDAGTLMRVQEVTEQTAFAGNEDYWNYMNRGGAYEWNERYRYDALGRRVWAWMQRGGNCGHWAQPWECKSTVTYSHWDGSQLSAEVRDNGDFENNGTAWHWPVQVAYLHVGETDKPQAVMLNGSVLVPHKSYRGMYTKATQCGGTVCDELELPGWTAFLGRTAAPPDPSIWRGSLLEAMTDASGLQYKRNRYYDPKSGAFTQVDPIGIAGGLNTYGYGGGDPVNFSDPFGLCPDCEDYWTDVAASGLNQGGVGGTAKVVVGITAATALEFFGVNDLWNAKSHAEAGRYGAAAGSLILAVGGNLPGGRVAANLKRTLKGAQGANVAVSQLGDFVRATWEVAGDNGGQSRTVWNKIINKDGKTVRMYHDSYDQAGNFQHRKFKVPDEHKAP